MRNISGPDGILVLLAASGRNSIAWTKFQGIAAGGIFHEDTSGPITGGWSIRQTVHNVDNLPSRDRDIGHDPGTLTAKVIH